MGFDFVVLGIILIWLLFYSDFRNQSNLVLMIGIVFLMIGYFVNAVTFNNISINFFNFFGMVYVLIFAIISGGVRVKNTLYCGVLIAMLYVLINYIKFDFNMFFDLKPFIFVAVAVNLINVFSVKEGLISTIFGLIICEIFNVFFMLKEIDFMPILSCETTFCIVVCTITQLVFNFLINRVKKVKHEKVF